jgi:signal transduction histidine kinase
MVNGDPARLAQIFGNLLDNASKYTHVGGDISLSVAAFADQLTVTVRDNGIGINAEALPHIFDLFVQDPRAKALHRGGLGIGLAVVRDLVESHGGRVAASSGGLDQGSEFVVTLPLAQLPANP